MSASAATLSPPLADLPSEHSLDLTVRSSVRDWLSLLRPGDWLILFAGLSITLGLFALSLNLGATQAPVDRAVIRRDGVVVAEIMLAVNRQFAVTGPLGTTLIDIEPGRARVRADPGPHQLCVRQGWLDRPNATALCLPNHISLQVLAPSSRNNRHDSIGY